MLTTLFDDIFVAVRKNSVDETQKALNAFLEWKEVNGMSYNTTKYKELSMAKKGVKPNFPPLCGIEQSDSLTLLGVTLQNDCKFLSHVKGKASGSKQLFVYFKITKKRWIHAGRDRSPLLGYCSAKDHRRTSSLWSQSSRFKHHTMLFKKEQ